MEADTGRQKDIHIGGKMEKCISNSIMCDYDISITMHLYDWINFSETVDCSVCW